MLLPELISADEAAMRLSMMRHPTTTRDTVLSKIEDFYFNTYGTTTYCTLTLWNEFRVVGISYCLHPLNFDRQLGEYLAFQEAVDKATPFIAYDIASGQMDRPLTSDERAQAERQVTPRPHTADVNFSAIYGVKELPAFKSHKIVWAARVITEGDNDGMPTWILEGGGVVQVSTDLAGRGGADPRLGYFVRYEDGYESWSPAAAFEDGYTRLG